MNKIVEAQRADITLKHFFKCNAVLDKGLELENDTDASGVHGVKSVNSMSLKVFRRKLVNHFKILFARNEMKWPARRPIYQMPK